jgi:uncharacterized phage protein (TIGR01671 family)
MREIKYKIYNPETGNMSPALDIFMLAGFLTSYYKSQADMAHLIFREFIGLNDRNGTPIFEGDVLRYHPVKTKRGTKKLKLKYRDTVIEWREDKCRWGQKLISPAEGESPWQGNFHDIANFKQHEVVGNQYENPKLIKGAA